MTASTKEWLTATSLQVNGYESEMLNQFISGLSAIQPQGNASLTKTAVF